MDEVRKVLEDFASNIEANYKKDLGYNRATGKLADSVKVEVSGSTGDWVITVYLEDYWKYIEEGRKPGGKFPPVNKLLQWIIEKNLQPRPYKIPSGSYKIPTEKQLAFLIGRKIAKEGLPAYNYLKNNIETAQAHFIEMLSAALLEEFRLIIFPNKK